MMIKLIHEGKAVWYPSPDAPPGDWSSAKKIIITKITAYYYSDAYGTEDNPQNWACPFAELEATVDLGETHFTARINCPITAGTIR
jgi:hypothetical protein